ncbi:hypothetical protein BH09SUM1_BH09SUM1_33730 [soil metagenome]
MFGSDDLVFVPEDGQLIFDDVYNWRRLRIDARNLGVRIRAAAFDEVAASVRASVDLLRVSPRLRDTAEAASRDAENVIRDLARHSGTSANMAADQLRDMTPATHAAWWLQLSDRPAESYSADDYDREATAPANRLGYGTYGTVVLGQLDSLEVPLAASEEGLPFFIEAPAKDGVVMEPMPALEPIALIDEFCGEHGVSARGRAINITTHAALSEAREFCTPVGKIGDSLYATLYFHYEVAKEAEIVGALSPEQILKCAAILEKSSFILAAEGPFHRIYERGGDVVHLYGALEGKESEGAAVMPPFMLVASAGGESDPMNRGALFDAIRDSIG